MKKLRTRFIVFNMLVISFILIILSLLVFFGSKSDISSHRLIVAISLSLILVFIGSFFISKIAITPIKKAWQKQLDFTADASHELRTPLAVIQTNLELVMDNPMETVESQRKWLDNIYIENKRMTKLVEDLLTLSRADTNQQNLDKTEFMLGDAIQEATHSFIPVAQGKEIFLNVMIDSQIEFRGDRNRIKQLLVILVDNALHYIKASERIDVELRCNEKEAQLIVSDTGAGIEPEHLDKIFDRFYRVTKTRNQNIDGSGLGLSIAKWIANEHSGSIHVESEPGKGTKFTVNLPFIMK